jgi:hypothetical protein
MPGTSHMQEVQPWIIWTFRAPGEPLYNVINISIL